MAPLFLSQSTKLSEDQVWQPSMDYSTQLQAKQQGCMVRSLKLENQEARARVWIGLKSWSCDVVVVV